MGGPSRNGAATGNQETKNYFAKTAWALTTLGTLRAGTHVAPFVRVRNPVFTRCILSDTELNGRVRPLQFRSPSWNISSSQSFTTHALPAPGSPVDCSIASAGASACALSGNVLILRSIWRSYHGTRRIRSRKHR